MRYLLKNNKFGYDAQNRLTSVTRGTVSLAYDGLNRVVTRTVNGTATDEPIFRWAAGSVLSYYHQDALGNVTTLTDTSGIPVESYRYDIYGEPTIYDPYQSIRSTSFFGNSYMFTAREYLAEAEVYQYRNRAYSPEHGRFLQPYPIRFAAGDQNLYRYVSNNPINLWDPLGLEATFRFADGSTKVANTGAEFKQIAERAELGSIEQLDIVGHASETGQSLDKKMKTIPMGLFSV